MTNTQKENNVIAGAIPNEITADWFNTKANEADCRLSVPLLFLEEGAIEGIAFCQSIKETGWFRFSQSRYRRHQ